MPRCITNFGSGALVIHLSEHHGDGTPGSIAYVCMTGIEALHRDADR
jgi:Glyoxalase superfamily protein